MSLGLYPLTSLFYLVKTGVYRGLHIFLIFALKHILWVPNEMALTCTHNICFEQKYENSQPNLTENCHFYSSETSLYIAWACFRNVTREFVLLKEFQRLLPCL